jgi:hypothetical protein
MSTRTYPFTAEQLAAAIPGCKAIPAPSNKTNAEWIYNFEMVATGLQFWTNIASGWVDEGKMSVHFERPKSKIIDNFQLSIPLPSIQLSINKGVNKIGKDILNRFIPDATNAYTTWMAGMKQTEEYEIGMNETAKKLHYELGKKLEYDNHSVPTNKHDTKIRRVVYLDTGGTATVQGVNQIKLEITVSPEVMSQILALIPEKE